MAGVGSKRRLFFALWPPDSIREEIDGTKRAFPHPQAKWTKSENLHITLAFLGNVEAQKVPALVESISVLDVEPFDLVLDTIVPLYKSSMLWLTPKHKPDELTCLVAELWKQLEKCGFTPEARPFAPHVTLARKIRGKSLSKDISPIHWPIESFNLVESQPGQVGSRYTIRNSWSFTTR